MKSRASQLLDRAISAMLAAIEVYNKPSFHYRDEAFAVLAINSWELLVKAKWLREHKNQLRSLYVLEYRNNKGGSRGKRPQVKKTRSGNPMTHSLTYLVAKLVEGKALEPPVLANIDALTEFRDSAVHFYNASFQFGLRLQEIGAATIKNFVVAVREWFGRDLSQHKFSPLPLSFTGLPQNAHAVILNAEEERFLAFLNGLEPAEADPASRYSVTVNIELRFAKSAAKDALAVRITTDPNAPAVRLTDEQILQKYPPGTRRNSLLRVARDTRISKRW